MEELGSIDPKISEVDIIYEVLKASTEHQGKKLRELLELAFTIKALPLDDPQKMASIHTQLMLDNRFNFLGQGIWGLKEWTQGKVVRRNLSYGARSASFRRRSLQDEIESEEKEVTDKADNTDNTVADEEEEWEED